MAQTEPVTGLTYGWNPDTENYADDMDANLRQLGAIIQLSVIDRDQTDPPASPSNGDRHIIAAGATGDWSGHDSDVAVYADSAWTFYTPRKGWQAYIESESSLRVWDGAAWTDNKIMTTVASLPASSTEGATAYATDGCKDGETTGNGTGVPVYYSVGQWRSYRDDSQVQA